MSGIYGFGDQIPSGPDTDLFVSYNVPGLPGGMLAGPYRERGQAEEELLDIAGYEGVIGAKIVRRKDLMKK